MAQNSVAALILVFTDGADYHIRISHTVHTWWIKDYKKPARDISRQDANFTEVEQLNATRLYSSEIALFCHMANEFAMLIGFLIPL